MPWYKLPHADMVMHFDQEMDLEPADEPTGMVDVRIPNAPEPEEETEAT